MNMNFSAPRREWPTGPLITIPAEMLDRRYRTYGYGKAERIGSIITAALRLTAVTGLKLRPVCLLMMENGFDYGYQNLQSLEWVITTYETVEARRYRLSHYRLKKTAIPKYLRMLGTKPKNNNTVVPAEDISPAEKARREEILRQRHYPAPTLH